VRCRLLRAHKYRNLKHEILESNERIYFKNHCLSIIVVPKLAIIKVSNHSPDRNLHNIKFIKNTIDELKLLNMKNK